MSFGAVLKNLLMCKKRIPAAGCPVNHYLLSERPRSTAYFSVEILEQCKQTLWQYLEKKALTDFLPIRYTHNPLEGSGTTNSQVRFRNKSQLFCFSVFPVFHFHNSECSEDFALEKEVVLRDFGLCSVTT